MQDNYMRDAAFFTNDTVETPLVTVTHSVAVSAYHRLFSRHKTEKENQAFYGDANQPHKHTFVFHVQFRGPICERSGHIPAAAILQDSTKLAITDLLDQKNLDEDIPYFRSRPSTIENLAVFAWRNMVVVMKPHPHELVKVKVTMNLCAPKPTDGESSVEAEYSGETVRVPISIM